jgi:hypothetical protein
MKHSIHIRTRLAVVGKHVKPVYSQRIAREV